VSDGVDGSVGWGSRSGCEIHYVCKQQPEMKKIWRIDWGLGLAKAVFVVGVVNGRLAVSNCGSYGVFGMGP
jgi:hypothetical protein